MYSGECESLYRQSFPYNSSSSLWWHFRPENTNKHYDDHSDTIAESKKDKTIRARTSQFFGNIPVAPQLRTQHNETMRRITDNEQFSCVTMNRHSEANERYATQNTKGEHTCKWEATRKKKKLPTVKISFLGTFVDISFMLFSLKHFMFTIW